MYSTDLGFQVFMGLGCWMVKGFWGNEVVKGESSVYKHVNLKHSVFKFYALTEGCHPRSMP